MTAFIWDKKLTYVSVPKVACSSIKSLFFEIENDRPFEEFVINGKRQYIHKFYNTVSFADLPHSRIADHQRFAVVRDPVYRLLSCYSNRVVHHRWLSKAKGKRVIEKAGLQYSPSLADFIDNLEAYRQVSRDIHHHSQPQVDFLGDDPAYFSRLYPLSKVTEFADAVSRIVGKVLILQKLQTGGPKISAESLTAAQRKKLMDFYEKDYEVYGRYL